MDITSDSACDTCPIRMFYARAHDMHFDWRDCWCECGYAKEMRAQQVKGSEDELKEVITALEKDLAQPYVPQRSPGERSEKYFEKGLDLWVNKSIIKM